VPSVQQLGGLYLIDTEQMGRLKTVGVFLLPAADGRFALIETGSAVSLPVLEAGIRQAGFAPEALAAILVTHIHLDHAGAAGVLAQRYGAEVYVHQAGAPHLADPSRLLASAERIYGADMARLWGEVMAVPEAQLRELAGGERLRVLGHELRVLYTPGHASHHLCFLFGDTLFTGDAAAIKLPGSPVIRPATPPPEVNLELWEASLDAMLALRPARLLLTHFGQVNEPQTHLALVKERNRSWAEAILAGLQTGEDDMALIRRITALGEAELRAAGASAEMIALHSETSSYPMTVTGLKRYWLKHHPKQLP
jgi:glyoxylase-like metal-dependent hydrolase (beta-lactamase superfamily II)